MLNSKQPNRTFAVGVVAGLATSILVVMATLVSAVGRMQALV